MLAGALQLLAFLKALPRSLQVGIGAFVLGILLVVGLVVYGEHRQAAKDAAKARADSTHVVIVALDTAQAHEAVAVAKVIATKPATVTTAKTRTAARALVTVVDSQTVTIGGQLDTVPTAVVALIKADDAKIAADSLHAVATDSLVAVIPVVEAAHAAVDTALTHQITQGDSEVHESSHVPLVVAALAVAEGARIAYNFFHHRALFP